MVKQLKDPLLHNFTKHNVNIQFNKYFNTTSFPAQDIYLLGSYVYLRFRDYYTLESYGNIEADENYYIREKRCRVVRCDIAEPFKMICISEDYLQIIVCDSRNYDLPIHVYPLQMTEYVGLKCFDQYITEYNEIKAFTLRVDDGEPCEAVIVEYLDNDMVRFVLEDECFTKLYDLYDSEDEEDPEKPSLLFNREDDKVTSFKILMYDKSNKDIADIRKKILGGKYIYEADPSRNAI